MGHAAPGAATEREVVLADAVPKPVDGLEVSAFTGRLVQLGQADQIPAQLVGLAGGDLGGVGAGERAWQQRQVAVGVGLRQHQLGEIEVAPLPRHTIELDGRFHQHRGRHAVVVAELGDVDAADGQRTPAQVADATRGGQRARVRELAMNFNQTEHQVAVDPDVPGAQ